MTMVSLRQLLDQQSLYAHLKGRSDGAIQAGRLAPLDVEELRVNE